MRLGKPAVTTVGVALVVRVARSRRRRFMRPAGRPFAGFFSYDDERYDATIRISKGVGTRGERADVRGLAVRSTSPAATWTCCCPRRDADRSAAICRCPGGVVEALPVRAGQPNASGTSGESGGPQKEGAACAGASPVMIDW